MNDLEEYAKAIRDFLKRVEKYSSPKYFTDYDLPNIWEYFTEDFYDANEDEILSLQVDIPETNGYIHFTDRAGDGWYLKNTSESMEKLEEEEPEIFYEYVRRRWKNDSERIGKNYK